MNECTVPKITTQKAILKLSSGCITLSKKDVEDALESNHKR